MMTIASPTVDHVVITEAPTNVTDHGVRKFDIPSVIARKPYFRASDGYTTGAGEAIADGPVRSTSDQIVVDRSVTDQV